METELARLLSRKGLAEILTIPDFERLLERYAPEERDQILAAARWAEQLHGNQKRASGEPYFTHPLQVAAILVGMQMDHESVIAALLHDVLEDTETSSNEMRRLFGRQVESLVKGVTKISVLKSRSKSEQGSETIRKMLFAMTKDIRVIIIKLADKLHNMSTLEHLPEARRREIAKECVDIYAPLADRLGISWLKAELEDLSLKHLHPQIYQQIKEHLLAKRTERAEYLGRVEKAINKAAKKEGLTVRVTTRAKHFYSIYKKMKYKDKKLEEIFDLLGIRILCETENDCYTLLGLVHRIWPPIEGRFKDYIAMPKDNQYQSLHTTVMGCGGRLIEIQIRTFAMHTTAEFGIAAHWAYKKGTKGRINPEDLAIISKLKSWDGYAGGSEEFLEEIKRELLKDSIYVFTPKGDIVELPVGSTPIDFAYHIHTEVGNHIVGAKADGNIIPLSAELANTQVIEILTSPKGKPNLTWLRSVKTERARSKIRQWLNKNDDTIIVDRNIIAKKKPAQPHQEPQPAPAPTGGGEVIKRVLDGAKFVFRIGNERNLMISLARCCNPSTGDDIIGYSSRGRGIVVHRKDCPNLAHIPDFQERNIEVEWEAFSPKVVKRFRVRSKVTYDLFSEIEGAIKKYKGHLIEGKLEDDPQGNLAGFFTIELEKADDYRKILKSIRAIPSIINIQSTIT